MHPTFLRRFVFLTALLFLLSPASRMEAQRTAFSIVGGMCRIPYSFATPVHYSNAKISYSRNSPEYRNSYCFGVDLNQAVSKHWQIKVGARMQITALTQEVDLHWPAENNGQGQYKPLYPNERLDMWNVFIEVPLMARYVFSERKLVPYAEAGLSTNYYLQSKIKETFLGDTETFKGRVEELRPVNFALVFAAGIQYRYSAKQSLFVQPVLRYQLNSVEEVTENRGLGFGMELGWRVTPNPVRRK